MIAMNKRSVVTLIAAIIAVLVSGMLVVPAASAVPASVSASVSPADTCPLPKYDSSIDYGELAFPLPIKHQPSFVGKMRVGSRVISCPAVTNPGQLGDSTNWFVINDDGTKKRVARTRELTIKPEWRGKRLQTKSMLTIPGQPVQVVWSKAWKVK
jgi:hypothetical protein